MSFGRLDRAPPAQPMSDINMTPLVDVMLVLVVIFIITAPLLASSIKLDLPHSDAARSTDALRAVTVVVDASGQAFLNDQAVSLAELARRLDAVHQNNADAEVQLRADRAVPYGRIVEVMGTAQKAGLRRIGFVAETLAATPTAPSVATTLAKP